MVISFPFKSISMYHSRCPFSSHRWKTSKGEGIWICLLDPLLLLLWSSCIPHKRRSQKLRSVHQWNRIPGIRNSPMLPLNSSSQFYKNPFLGTLPLPLFSILNLKKQKHKGFLSEALFRVLPLWSKCIGPGSVSTISAINPERALHPLLSCLPANIVFPLPKLFCMTICSRNDGWNQSLERPPWN